MKKIKQLFKYSSQLYKNIWKQILEKSKLTVDIPKTIADIIKTIADIIKTIAGIIKTIVNKSISFLLNAIALLLLVVMVYWVYFFIDAEVKVIFTNIEVGSIIQLIEKKLKIEFSLIGSGVIAIVGLILFYQRLKKQEEQIDLQRKKRTDDRFTTVVNLLGSSETSARTGAISSLYHLAIEDKKHRKEIAQILCSHIRSKTNEPDYKKEHKERASNEIQTTIDLLLKDKNGNKGVYCQDFAKEKNFPQVNFEYAYLVKADFAEAQCQGADFNHAQCQGADFSYTQCQGAGFSFAHCQRSSFSYTQCQGAGFSFAQCQGAYFNKAQCQGAHFSHAQCQGANFHFAQCQGADFSLHSVKEQILIMHSVKEHIFMRHSVKELM